MTAIYQSVIYSHRISSIEIKLWKFRLYGDLKKQSRKIWVDNRKKVSQSVYFISYFYFQFSFIDFFLVKVWKMIFRIIAHHSINSYDDK